MGKIDFDKTNEAFRAGNRARKKETMQDTVESVVNNIQAQIDLFKEQTGKELEIKDGRPYFDGDLWLNVCTELTSLPAGLRVKGNLSLERCIGLTSLPEGLEVGENLWMGSCIGLTSLPNGLKVGGNLSLERCTGLTSLPSDLIVQGIWIIHKGILTPFFKKLGIRVDKYGTTKASDWCKWQEAHGYLTEAFRAGNKARKKETIQDNTDAVSKWRIPKKLETIDDWEAAFLLNTESVGITAAPIMQSGSSGTTRIYNLYVRSWENNSVTFSVAVTKTDFYSGDSPLGIIMRVIFKLNASIGMISMHMVPDRDAERNSAERKIYTDLSEALDAVYEIINYLRNSRHIGQVLKNPIILEFDSSDVTTLVIEEYLRSEPGCPLIWDRRDEDTGNTFLTDYANELKRAAAVRPWINWHGDTEVLAEAFKAGNRARKRESVADAADAGIDTLSVCSIADRLIGMGFNIRCGKNDDYTEVRKIKPAEEIDSIIFNKWYTPSGKEPKGIIDESLILIRGGYGTLNDKETGKKMPYISVELHADIKIDDKTVSRYQLSSLSSSWSDILNLTVFDKVDDVFLPKMNLLLRLFSDSDRILREIYGLLKDNILMLKVEQKTRKAYLHRILCRVMPEFGIWSYSSRFGGDLEVDPDSYAWEASGWIKIPETPQTPVNEAFRAGNRARKKETVQDTASDNVDPPIKFEDPNVEKICHEHGVFTIGDAARVETIQGWFEIDGGAGIDNPQIVKFNELQYFTGLTTIPVNAFLEQEKLEEIIIPDNVTVIDQCAFDSCRSLTRLVLPDRPGLELGSDCLQSCDGLDEVVVPSGWSGWRCIQEMKSAYEDELEWYQEKIDNNGITEESSLELLDARLNTFFINRQDTLDCRFSDLLDWWTGDDNPDPDDDEELSEAFRAGNRARKKEAAADSVESYGALDDRNKCAEMMKTMLTSPECPAVRITGDRPAAIEDAPAIDPADIKISEHLQGSNQDYTLIVLKWEGVDQADPAQNLSYVTEISFSEATDGSGLLISGGCFAGGDLADFSPLPEICVRADAQGIGRPRLWELCYVEDWETVDPDGMTYSKVSVNAIAAVAAAVRQLKERDRRKDPSSLGRYPVDEAFRAGNKARKKEAAADSVESVWGINVNNIKSADIARMFQGAISTTQALYRITNNDVNPPFEPVFPMYMKWFIDLVASMYIRTTIPWPRNIRITDYDGMCSDDVNGQTFTIDADSIKSYDFHILILPGYDPNTYSVWRKDTIHLMDVKFKPEYPEQSEIVVKPACIYFVHDIIDSYRRFFKDKKVLDEAFRAGNRARKKESAADTVQDTDTFTSDDMPADKIIPNLFLSAVSTTHALLRTQGIINPPFKPEFPNYMKWFIDIITSMYIKTSISWQRRIWIMNVKGSPGRNNGQEFDINLEMGVRKYHFLITPGSKENQYAVWFKMTMHLFDIDFNPDYPEQSKINIAPAMKYFIAGFLETYRMFFEEKGVLEAFKAGNQARKKESVQDAVSVVDTPIRFEDPVVRRYMEEHGITTVSKAANTILSSWDADEHDDRFRPERFNEFKLFTSMTLIEDYMFNGQENLEEIELPPTVQSIGYGAFRSCLSLENLDIPNSCRELGEDCLAGCDSLEYVGFPDSWTYDYAFEQFAKAFNDDIAYLPDTLADNDVGSWNEMPFPDATITNNYYTFHLSDLFKNFGDQDALKVHGLLDEAFRAGNRVRKKESAVDTVDSVDAKFSQEEVAKWFRDAIESDRNTIPKDNPHAWPAMCLVNDVVFTRLALNNLVDKIKDNGKFIDIESISHSQFCNPGDALYRTNDRLVIGSVDMFIRPIDGNPSFYWIFSVTIEKYNGNIKDYCYKLYVTSYMRSEDLLPGPKDEPFVTVYVRRTPYEIEVNKKFIDWFNRKLFDE